MRKNIGWWIFGLVLIAAVCFVSWYVCQPTLIASVEAEDCLAAPCRRVDVEYIGSKIRFGPLLDPICVYEASLHLSYGRVASNQYRFDRKCPTTTTVTWNRGSHATIHFDAKEVQLRFEGDDRQWKSGPRLDKN